MYSKATVDFNSPESVVMAISDYVEFVKETTSKVGELEGQISELEEMLREEKANADDFQEQVTKQEFYIRNLEDKISTLKERIGNLGGDE